MALGPPVRRAESPRGTVHVGGYTFGGIWHTRCGLSLPSLVPVDALITCGRCIALTARDPNGVRS